MMVSASGSSSLNLLKSWSRRSLSAITFSIHGDESGMQSYILASPSSVGMSSESVSPAA